MVVAIHSAGRVGVTRGYSVFSNHAGPTKSSKVHFTLGYEGPPKGQGQQGLLDLDGDEYPHGHQPQSAVFSDYL